MCTILTFFCLKVYAKFEDKYTMDPGSSFYHSNFVSLSIFFVKKHLDKIFHMHIHELIIITTAHVKFQSDWFKIFREKVK